jgi:hypothetical protein
MAINGGRSTGLCANLDRVEMVLAYTPALDKRFAVPPEHFLSWQRKTYEAVQQQGVSAGVAFSSRCHLVSGLEGNYVAQLSGGAQANVEKTDFFKLPGEEYPAQPVPLKEVLGRSHGREGPSRRAFEAKGSHPDSLVSYPKVEMGGRMLLSVKRKTGVSNTKSE